MNEKYIMSSILATTRLEKICKTFDVNFEIVAPDNEYPTVIIIAGNGECVTHVLLRELRDKGFKLISIDNWSHKKSLVVLLNYHQTF